MNHKVDQVLNREQAAGIIEPVQFSEWAASVVSVLKSDGGYGYAGATR